MLKRRKTNNNNIELRGNISSSKIFLYSMPTGDKIKLESTVTLFRYVYMYWYPYIYIYISTRNVQTVRLSIRVDKRCRLPLPDNQTVSQFSLSAILRAFLRIRKRCKHNSRGKLRKFIGMRVHLRSLLHLPRRIYRRFCYVSLDLQFKSRLDHVLKRWVTAFVLSIRGKGSVHGRNFIRLDKSDVELCEILFSAVKYRTR